jgi:hypothetical protein
MPGQSTETQLALLTAGLKEVTREVEEVKEAEAKERAILNAKITALEDERNKALKWGVLALGTAVASMAAWIWTHMPVGRIP